MPLLFDKLRNHGWISIWKTGPPIFSTPLSVSTCPSVRPSVSLSLSVFSYCTSFNHSITHSFTHSLSICINLSNLLSIYTCLLTLPPCNHYCFCQIFSITFLVSHHYRETSRTFGDFEYRSIPSLQILTSRWVFFHHFFLRF